jgi:hypothetical protein
MRLDRTVALAVGLALLPLGALSQTHHSSQDETHSERHERLDGTRYES